MGQGSPGLSNTIALHGKQKHNKIDGTKNKLKFLQIKRIIDEIQSCVDCPSNMSYQQCANFFSFVET